MISPREDSGVLRLVCGVRGQSSEVSFLLTSLVPGANSGCQACVESTITC